MDVYDVSEMEDLLQDVAVQLFKDAGVQFARTSSRGQDYSIIEDAFQEFMQVMSIESCKKGSGVSTLVDV